MKTVEIKSFLMSFEDASKYIYEIFGDDAKIEFDDKCVTNIRINIFDGELKSFIFEYNKIAAKPNDGKVIYWPIQPQLVHKTIDFAKSSLKEKI